jgi:hypothetical protein
MNAVAGVPAAAFGDSSGAIPAFAAADYFTTLTA